MTMNTPTVCIAGKNRIAIDGLRHARRVLGADHEIYVVCNRNDHGQDGWQPSLRKFAASLPGVRIIEFEEAQLIKDVLFISLEFDRILVPDAFRSARLFNIHFSLLPRYKGMYTSAHPLLNGDSESGCTLHGMDAGIDTGPIIAQHAFALDESATAKDLYALYIECGRALLFEQFGDILSNQYISRPQPITGSSYFGSKSIDYSNVRIEFRKTAWQIHNQLRAFTFRDYQLPQVSGHTIATSRLTDNRSQRRPGSLETFDPYTLRLATIDHDLLLCIDRFSELVEAVRAGEVELVRRILDHNPSLAKETTPEGWSPAAIAAYNGQIEVLRALLDRGIDPAFCNQKGTSLLMYAKSGAENSGNLDALSLLLERGAPLDSRDIYDRDVFDYLKTSTSDYRRAIETTLSNV